MECSYEGDANGVILIVTLLHIGTEIHEERMFGEVKEGLKKIIQISLYFLHPICKVFYFLLINQKRNP